MLQAAWKDRYQQYRGCGDPRERSSHRFSTTHRDTKSAVLDECDRVPQRPVPQSSAGPQLFAGVDTHSQTPTIAVLTATGQVVATETFTADAAGYRQVITMLRRDSGGVGMAILRTFWL